VKEYVATHTSPTAAKPTRATNDPLQTTRQSATSPVPSSAAANAAPRTAVNAINATIGKQETPVASQYPSFFCLICVVTKVFSFPLPDLFISVFLSLLFLSC
jgi:hypothetical protein